MSKLCLIFRRSALYRKAIHQLIDKEYECDWYFGDLPSSISEYDRSILRNNHYSQHVVSITNSFYFTKGTVSRLFDKRYDTYLMSSDTRDLAVWMFAFCKRLFFQKKKVYYWGHGWYGKEHGITSAIKKFIIKSCDGMFVYGDYAVKLMIQQNLLPSSKLYSIHNSLDYEEQLKLRQTLTDSNIYKDHFGNNNPTLIFIGRLTPVKQLDMILKAMSISNKAGKHYNMVFVGDGEMRQELERMTDNLQLNSQVWFYGKCYDDHKNSELLYNADLCVAPGNIGLTSMHCLVFGCPAITHNNFSWQMPEFEAIKAGVTGDFFEYKNVDSLAKTIDNWFANHTDKELTRKACYEEIANNWNPFYQIKIFNSVLKTND